MSTLHDTCDAVVALLNAGVTADAFAVDFTAATSYDTELLLEDAGTVSVVCVPASSACVADSRVSLRYDVGIDVALRYRFGTTDQETTGKVKNASIETYIELLEEMGEYLAYPTRRALPTKLACAWTGNELRYPWIPDHLRQHRQFTGIFRATYRVAVEP